MIVHPPVVPAKGFSWRAAPWGVALQADALERFPHGWSTRQLPLRGTPEVEAAGWTRVAEAGRVPVSSLVRLRQVHGAGVVYAEGPRATATALEADAAVSKDRALLLTVQVADCVPLLMANTARGAVSVVHAGWRGTAAGICGAAVAAMMLGLGAPPVDLCAAMGPSIGPCCYEVGAELIDAFRLAGHTQDQVAAWFERRNGSWYLDLWRANVDQLAAAGVPRSAIHVSRLCTACHPEWFDSYRRDGASTGRLVAYIRPA